MKEKPFEPFPPLYDYTKFDFTKIGTGNYYFILITDSAVPDNKYSITLTMGG